MRVYACIFFFLACAATQVNSDNEYGHYLQLAKTDFQFSGEVTMPNPGRSQERPPDMEDNCE